MDFKLTLVNFSVGGHHCGDCQQGRSSGNHPADCGWSEGWGGTVQEDGDGNHREDHGEPRSGRHWLTTGGTADWRYLVRLSGTDHRGNWLELSPFIGDLFQ